MKEFHVEGNHTWNVKSDIHQNILLTNIKGSHICYVLTRTEALELALAIKKAAEGKK